MTISYIDNWVFLKDDHKYTNLLLCTIRSIFTFLKNLNPSVSRHNEMYVWTKKSDLVQPTRFDTIEKNVMMESHKNLYNSKYNEMMTDYNRELERNASHKVLLSGNHDRKIGGITP